MARLILNRIDLQIVSSNVKLYLSMENKTNYLKSNKPTTLLRELDKNCSEEIKKWLMKSKEKDIKDEPRIYFSFYEGSEKSVIVNTCDYKFKKFFIRETLIKHLFNQYFIVEPYKEGCDFCVYEKIGDHKYRRYDFIIHCYYDKKTNKHINIDEISISVGSHSTYIVEYNINNIDEGQRENIKVVYNNLLIKYKDIDNKNLSQNFKIKANSEIRNKLRIFNKPKFQFYKESYEHIKNFIEKYIVTLNETNDYLKVYRTLKESDKKLIKLVDFDKNKIVFKNDKEGSSQINGMRDYGPYNIPDNIKNVKLLFIYPDSDSANKLFVCFSKGYHHFPGLESYVGIPAQPFEKKIKYGSYISEKILDYINIQLPEKNYNDLMAICIMPFDKQTATPEQSNIYFKIKEILLSKNIPSQFIYRKKIFLDTFHYYLPNIAIAMLAKLGGVPWKLKKEKYNQLTIGFNIYRKNENIFIGSAVYFNNEGVLKKVDAFKAQNSIQQISNSLKKSINNYIDENGKCERIVIHYFKPVSKKEFKSINKMLENEIKLDIPVAFIEINDTKISTDICFDLDYVSYMPQSGTYVRLKPNQYLLFNNLRYWEKPINPIKKEEYPIKLKIFDPLNIFNYHELISQVYEFSRLYWKGLKQKAQPVTTLYSKLIAQYAANFTKESIPDNFISQKTVWFV